MHLVSSDLDFVTAVATMSIDEEGDGVEISEITLRSTDWETILRPSDPLFSLLSRKLIEIHSDEADELLAREGIQQLGYGHTQRELL